MTPEPGATFDGPQPIGPSIAAVTQRILSRPVSEPGADAAREQWQAAENRNRQWRSLIAAVGERYEPCRLKNFVVSSVEAVKAVQEDVLEKLVALSRNMVEHVESGGNVILYGPPGTGKDHLLVAILGCAIANDFKIEWRNGQDLFGDFRDRIDTDRSEESSIRHFESPHILAISDPVPPRGSASDFTTTMLYRIIDRRYRCLKSTWITANVSKKDEARAELSAPIFDRLADNCLAVFCNWPSYRQSRRPGWLK